MGKILQLLSGKHELNFYLIKKVNLLGFPLNFNILCCSCNQSAKDSGEFIMDEHRQSQKANNNNGKELYDNNTYNTLSVKTEKMDYYKRFKDCDSYNDYIIHLDSIIGV